jgi:hypothetical protein
VHNICWEALAVGSRTKLERLDVLIFVSPNRFAAGITGDYATGYLGIFSKPVTDRRPRPYGTAALF